MSVEKRAVRRLLESTGLPRARFIGTENEPRWTFGFGISEADGQLTVWCNPGGPSREAWHRSSMLADRVDQCLTIGGYRTYRDRDRDPQQVIIMGQSHTPRRLENLSRTAALGCLAFCALFIFVQGQGVLLLAALCLATAMWFGIQHERELRHDVHHQRRDSVETQEGTTA